MGCCVVPSVELLDYADRRKSHPMVMPKPPCFGHSLSYRPLVSKSVYLADFCGPSLINKHSRFLLKNQTYKNIEILLCDDKSTDDSYELMLKASKKDTRIKLFWKKPRFFTKSLITFVPYGTFIIYNLYLLTLLESILNVSKH